MGRLDGRVAIVTGSDSGIGQATAIEFAKEGADVTITYHTDKKGALETQKAVQAFGARSIVVQLDQRDPKSVEQVYNQTVDVLGIPDVLVNNAGAAASEKNVKDMSIQEWDDIIRTDLHGPFYFCRLFIRGMDGMERQGKIVNVTSVHEDIPSAGTSAYCAAKGGLRNLTRVLALELAEKNINVNNIAPGMVLTPMNQEAMDDPKVRKEQSSNIPVKRAAKPEEIARAIVYLCSEEAGFIQGESLFIDGGQRLMVGQGA